MIGLLKNILQGKPFKHPIHPALVHFPISLFLAGLAFDIIAWIGAQDGWSVKAAYYSLVAGEIMGLLAGSVGLIDWLDIRKDHPARKTATIHLILNLCALVIFGVNLGFRSLLPEYPDPLLRVALSTLGVGLVLISGFLGGRIIYGDGIAIGRYRRSSGSPTETIKAAAADFSDGYLTLASEEKMRDCQILRVAVDGEVLAIARSGDEFFAFNEFCTHRFGPLSEGALHDGRVECPWHRSCFDIRSGKVIDGPAKVDLKTYPIKVEDGKIKIRFSKELSIDKKAFTER